MKIYFTASARGKSRLGDAYQIIFDTLKDSEYELVDDLILHIDADNLYLGNRKDQIQLYEQAIEHIKTSNIVILEISVHSLSMGYVLNRSLEEGKPVISLYQHGYKPYFALGIENDKLQVVEYSKTNIKNVLKIAINYAKEQQDVRFTMLLSPKLVKLLEDKSSKKQLSKSEYIRRLIKEDIEKNRS